MAPRSMGGRARAGGLGLACAHAPLITSPSVLSPGGQFLTPLNATLLICLMALPMCILSDLVRGDVGQRLAPRSGCW